MPGLSVYWNTTDKQPPRWSKTVKEVRWRAEMTEDKDSCKAWDEVRELRGAWSFFFSGCQRIREVNTYGGVNIWIEPWERRGFGKHREGKWEVDVPGWANKTSKSTGERNPESQSWELTNDALWITLSKERISASRAFTPKVGGDNQARVRESHAAVTTMDLFDAQNELGKDRTWVSPFHRWGNRVKKQSLHN